MLSDHAPADVVLHPLDRAEKSMRCRFNNCMLNREENCNFIKSGMLEFWEHDEGSIEDHGIMWDAFKSFLRGRVIQRSSFIKKAESQRLFKLEQDIKKLEKQHVERQNSHDILNRKTEFALFCTRQKYFEQGERAGKVLAHRVKQIQSQNVIPSIFDKDNNLLTNKRDINTTFREFYQELYTSQGGTDKNKLERFFSSTEIPTLTQDGRAHLEGDISVDEVKKAIRNLRIGKAPGNGGFSVDFYQNS